ncbi:hypothetical protein GCM10028810_71780 [Spirosoma litoris]
MACYSFTKGIKDESGNNNLVQNRGATPTADRFGNEESAYAFDGNSYMELPSNTFNTEEFTYTAWVKPAYIPSWNGNNGVLTIISTGNSNGDHVMVLANTTVQGWGMWSYTKDRAYNNFAYSGVLPTSTAQWYHILASRSKDSLKIYVNGTLSASQKMTAPPLYDGSVRTLIGLRFNGTLYFSGVIDEIKIYNRALSDGEAKLVYETN